MGKNDFMRLMLISTQVEVVVEVGVELGKSRKAEYVQRSVCFVNVQSSLHENVIFSVCAAYIMFIM